MIFFVPGELIEPVITLVFPEFSERALIIAESKSFHVIASSDPLVIFRGVCALSGS
jgi:hypothetical protein